MSQPPQSPRAASPLTARLYDLEYPRSLGVYNTYQEVQSVVDTLADKQFPVQSTLIVGTDLKLMERVTGRRTWPKVIGQGALSGLWMGLFLGLLLLLLSPGNITVVLTSVVLGVVFFTVSSVISYAMTGGRRDFTSMTATIPMQYELLVEHKHAAQAQQILAASGAAPAPTHGPTGGGADRVPQPSAPYGGGSHSGGQQFGAPASRPRTPSPSPSPSAPSPSRPSYGQPAPSSPAPGAGTARSGRPSFGMPAGAPLREPSPSSAPSGHGSPPVGTTSGAAGPSTDADRPPSDPHGPAHRPEEPASSPDAEEPPADRHPSRDGRPWDGTER